MIPTVYCIFTIFIYYIVKSIELYRILGLYMNNNYYYCLLRYVLQSWICITKFAHREKSYFTMTCDRSFSVVAPNYGTPCHPTSVINRSVSVFHFWESLLSANCVATAVLYVLLLLLLAIFFTQNTIMSTCLLITCGLCS